MITKFPKALTVSCFTTLYLHILWNVVSNRCSSQPIRYPDLIRFAFLLLLPLYAFSAGFWILSLLHHLHIFRMVSCTAQQKRILLLLTVLGFLFFFSARLLIPFFSVLSKTVVLHVSLGMGALLSYFLLNWTSSSPSPTKD